jgi:tetratricopeptide (TPR) repeat protein
MTGKSEASDDDLASILAECDEALAQGSLPAIDQAEAQSPDQARLLKSLKCVRILRGMWRRPHSTILPAEPRTGPATPTPRKIGRFTIVRELGHGGFGIVYLAIDPTVARPVALKVPRPDLHLTSQLLERFRQEARAAGALDHPNIVPVYEAGEVDSISYIAAAFCPGMSLARWLEDRKEPVPMRLAAELVAQLADGVENAHSRNILHRDIKPANVILWCADSDKPETASTLLPKITDFGLAKSLIADRKTELTAAGAILGTPNYLAPEQTEAGRRPIGPAVDIYGLGAILYEMLTRRAPFASDSVLETLRQVRFDEPISPRQLRAQVPRDLETICLKCLEKNPHRRYGTAAALAADLRRFTHDEPIQARPVSPVERLMRWCRRNPLAAGLAAGLMLAIVVGVGGVVSQWLRAEDKAERERNEHRLAERSRLAALAERDHANASRDRARAAVVRMTQAGIDLYKQPGQQSAGRKIIEEAVTFHESFVADKSDDPSVIRDAARAWRSVAYYRDELGQHKAAIEAERRSIALFEMLLATAPDDSTRLELARQKRRLAYFHAILSQLADAIKAYEEAITAFRVLCAQAPDNVEYKLNLANALMNFADVVAEDFPNRAEHLYREAMTIHEQCLEATPQDDLCRTERALGMESMGWLLWHRDRSPHSAELLSGAINAFRQLAHERPEIENFRWYAARSRQVAGRIAAGQHRLADAEKEFQAGITEFEDLRKRAPQTVQYTRHVFSTLVEYGELQRRNGRFAEAEATLRKAVDLINATAPKYPEGESRLRDDLASLYANQWLLLAGAGREQEAADFVKKLESAKPQNATALIAIARAMLDETEPKTRNPAEAIRLARWATDLEANQPDHWLVLGLAQLRGDDAKSSIQSLETASKLKLTYSPEIGLLQALAFRQVGDRANAAKRLAEAKSWLADNGTINSRVPGLLAESESLIENSSKR